ncbi:hypothetical protein K4L06_09295 [Lysobacter sp. BMK333-48F3]|uniref:hypothetical protein n=1 Tax=Lysobacter sp. BMK333-48F3 TaxID=2867962 RepID=UPI001C8B68BD|nr:hypothetical protein [Lysobacter sp. BMK333-48F3]MBX9401507.1 hypothetical protein [Lysobacter sp. BMK333-48F3]
MITEEQARQIVLTTAEHIPLAIYGCELSPRGDYWVIEANSEAWVLHGEFSDMLVGVSAYLVHTVTGRLSLVGSAQHWPDCVEDLHDLEVADGRHYLLVPGCDADDKQAAMHLHRQLACSLLDIGYLLSPAGRNWLTGTRRALAAAQAVLQERGIATDIVLMPEADAAILVEVQDTSWGHVSLLVRRRASGRQGRRNL